MRFGVPVLLLTLLLPGCRNSVTTPTDTGPQPYSVTEAFTGTLSVSGTQFQAFNVLQTASTSITLVGEIASGTNSTLSVPLTLGLGSLAADGSACTPTQTADVTPRLTAHLAETLTVSTYCVSVSDPGSLTGDVDFSVLIAQHANTTPGGAPGVEVFSSNLYPSGAGNRTFLQSETGDIVVVLSSVSPAAAIGLGLGVSSDGMNCLLHEVLVSTPGATAELSATAEAGSYCVRVFDPGGLPQRVVFNVQITHR